MDFFTQYSTYIFVLIGLLAGVPAVWVFRRRTGVKSGWGVLGLCLLYSVSSLATALVFAKLEALLTGGSVGSGAVSTYGIYLIAPFILMLAAKLLKLNTAGVMDVFALYAMPSFCTGLPMFQTGLCWPVREAEMVFYVVMFIVFWRMLKKNEIPGQIFPLLMISYGVVRFILQWFRDDGVAGVSISHIWSVICAVIGLALLMEFKARAEKQARKKNNIKK